MKEKQKKIYGILYLIMLALVSGMLLWMLLHYDGPNPAAEQAAEPVSFEDGWVTADGSPVTLNRLTDLDFVEPNQPFSIYHTLPESLTDGVSFCFRSKNIYYTVYIDGNLVYDPYVPENAFYNETFGTRWNYIPLTAEDAGKEIELRITTVYDSSRTGLSYTYLASSASFILDTIQSKLVAFITCVLILFVGVILMFADIPINMQSKKNHELLDLGLFAITIAIWCLTETNLLQFFIGDSRMLSVLSCCSLMLIPIPMVLYLDSAFGFRNKFVVPVISLLSFTCFAICTMLHCLKLVDFHDTLKVTHIMLGISAVVLFYTIIRHSLIKGKDTTKNIYRILRGVGLSSISIATGIDIYRFYRQIGSDSAMFVRIGLLIFIICYGTSSLEKTINAVRLGIQTEFVSQLAYRDGLTGIGNRTAFQEHLVSLEAQKDELESIGILMFDVNDLKFVNDYFGHHAGDTMLIQSANMIKEAFSPFSCDCYRIGGDEFAILISGADVKQRCEQGLESFRTFVDNYNQNPEKPFRISIAHGYSLYDPAENKKLMDVYQQADTHMYANKKWLKSQQPKMEELYSDKTTKLTT